MYIGIPEFLSLCLIWFTLSCVYMGIYSYLQSFIKNETEFTVKDVIIFVICLPIFACIAIAYFIHWILNKINFEGHFTSIVEWLNKPLFKSKAKDNEFKIILTTNYDEDE